MSRISFENFGQRARESKDFTSIAGRYADQASAEKEALRDVLRKLDLRSTDSLLDIGCNVGNFLIPFSFLVRISTGVDHPDCLRVLRSRFHDGRMELLAGDFMELKVAGPFNKILCYSVLHYLSDAHQVKHFVAKALSLLAPGGRALFGDIPLVRKKERFLDSAEGKSFDAEWRRKRASNPTPEIALPPDPDLVQFDDLLVQELEELCSQSGCRCELLDQPPELPFSFTRSDLLVVRGGSNG
jgi:SAM-dependent methyltransferase